MVPGIGTAWQSSFDPPLTRSWCGCICYWPYKFIQIHQRIVKVTSPKLVYHGWHIVVAKKIETGAPSFFSAPTRRVKVRQSEVTNHGVAMPQTFYRCLKNRSGHQSPACGKQSPRSSAQKDSFFGVEVSGCPCWSWWKYQDLPVADLNCIQTTC